MCFKAIWAWSIIIYPHPLAVGLVEVLFVGCMPRPPRSLSGLWHGARLSDMSIAQISALVFGVGGFGALVAATTSNEWKVTTRASSVITATWVYQGLWMNCAGNALGSFHCRPHFTIFKVEGKCHSCVWVRSKMVPFPAAVLEKLCVATCARLCLGQMRFVFAEGMKSLILFDKRKPRIALWVL